MMRPSALGQRRTIIDVRRYFAVLVRSHTHRKPSPLTSAQIPFVADYPEHRNGIVEANELLS